MMTKTKQKNLNLWTPLTKLSGFASDSVYETNIAYASNEGPDSSAQTLSIAKAFTAKNADKGPGRHFCRLKFP